MPLSCAGAFLREREENQKQNRYSANRTHREADIFSDYLRQHFYLCQYSPPTPEW
jgi:hypothetical protein